MKTFLADALCALLIPLQIVLALLILLVVTMAAFYPIPLVGYFQGEEWLFAEGTFQKVLLATVLGSELLLLLGYLRLSKVETRFADFFTSRQLRAVLLACMAIVGFVGFGFHRAYQAKDFAVIGRDLEVIHYQWRHFFTDPVAHFNEGEECESCVVYEADWIKDKAADFGPAAPLEEEVVLEQVEDDTEEVVVEGQ